MPGNLEKLKTFHPESGNLQVVIETPKGCRNKYSYDAEHGLCKLKSVMPAGHVFPFDFGFIPGTQGEDGDPLDILLLMEEPAAQGCLLEARLIAAIEAEQTEDGQTERNDRLIGVSAVSHEFRSVDALEKLNPNLAEEIEQFFVSYNRLAGKQFKPVRRLDARRATELVRKGMQATSS